MMYIDKKVPEITEYNCVDLLKLIMAFFVIAIHSGLINIASGICKDILNDIFALAVPYFFIVSGFLLFKKIYINNWGNGDKKRVLKYLFKILKLYGVWTIIYMPVTIYGEVRVYNTSFPKAIVKVLKNILLVGGNFYSWQLWYLLGLAVALIIIYELINLKIKYKFILLLSVVVYALGIFIDLLNNRSAGGIISVYYILFNTTRNGIFYGFFYVSVGMYISQAENLRFTKFDTILIIISIVAALLFNSSEFLRIFIAVIAILIFKLSVFIKPASSYIYKIFRNMSMKIYLVHMYFIAIYRGFAGKNNYIGCFLFAVIGSVVFSLLFIYIERKSNSKFIKLLF